MSEIDIDMMVEYYKRSFDIANNPDRDHLTPKVIYLMTCAYKQGLEDILNLIKKGGKDD